MITKETNYSKMTQEEYDSILFDIVNGLTIETLMSLPGIYEIVLEELNNDVLTEWERRSIK